MNIQKIKELENDLIMSIRCRDKVREMSIRGLLDIEMEKESLMKWVWYR
tara:strand:- start:731 stop:877 length:147 start_codon:yes stop_codon:yes gene_type:complete